MASSTITTVLRAPAALAARRHRHVVPAVGRHFRVGPVRAQQKEGVSEPEERDTAVAPTRSSPGYALDSISPSWGRMNQMFHQMEQEMNALSRSFGMPSFGLPSFGMPSSLFTDLPAAADLPALSAKALAVDIKDSGTALEITADVPGLSKDDIRVQVSPDRVLSISGERRSEHREGSEEGGNLRIERSYGTFMRRFRLPENVDVEGIKASTKDGVLRLTVPKTEETKHKQIDVQVSE